MKLWLLFLALVGTVAVCRTVAEGPDLGPAASPSIGVELRRVGAARSIVIGVLDPCKRPHPPPGCQNPHAPRLPVHNYTRPCSKINRCRGSPPRREAIDV
ncbi:Long-chain-alcohol oxidase [Psidium guajava]|nr:Long-chain-alcohol oxidase [Psidium guajava]